MALDSATVKHLLEKLEADRAAYLASQNKLQEVLIQLLQGQNSASPSQPDGNFVLPNFARTLTADSDAEFRKPTSIVSRRTGSITLDGTAKKITSLYSAEDSSDSDDGESYYANDPLPAVEFSEEDLREHIRGHEWNQHEKLIFGPMIRSGKLYSPTSLFADGEHTSDADHTTADIYEVGDDGAPLQRSRSDVLHGDHAAWEVLRSTNKDENRKQAVGRIIVLREPSPLLYGALHLTMSSHFDMDSLYKMLIDDHQRTKAYVSGSKHSDPRHQRSLVFCFKYHTMVGENREPLEWQNHDDDIGHKDGHIPISTCSSVVALSLSGPPARTFRRHSRRSRKPEIAHVYDPFAPWHVITIQNFPDWNSEVDLHETHHHYVNGPDAFLTSLLHEYRDAAKRFRELARAVTNFTMPAQRTMFDDKIRDELIFESGDFVFTRRYFWASQTLGILSEEIEAMITTYRDTFTDEVWSGEHRTLFPGKVETSARFANWRKKMAHTRRQFDLVIGTLIDVQRFIAKEQKEIKSLREWLFSGTSVQESRQAVKQALITVEQGYNIKLLTLVTIFFLPLMFVTGVFGMTNMPEKDDFVPAIAMAVAVCLPTYLLIAIINKPEAFQKGVAWLLWPWVLCYNWTKRGNDYAVDYAKLYKEKYLVRHKFKKGEKAAKKGGWMGFQSGGNGRGWGRSATFASLDARLEQENRHATGQRTSRPFAFAQPSDVTVQVDFAVKQPGPPATVGGTAPSGDLPISATSRTIEQSILTSRPKPQTPKKRSSTRGSSTIRFDTASFHPTAANTPPQHSMEPSPNTSVPNLTTRNTDATTGLVIDRRTETTHPTQLSTSVTVPIPEIQVDSPTTPPRSTRPGFLRRFSSKIGSGTGHAGNDTAGRSQV